MGRIVKAWRHPDAESLYVEEVDMGEEGGPRTICSGLVKYIPEEQMQVRGGDARKGRRKGRRRGRLGEGRKDRRGTWRELREEGVPCETPSATDWPCLVSQQAGEWGGECWGRRGGAKSGCVTW